MKLFFLALLFPVCIFGAIKREGRDLEQVYQEIVDKQLTMVSRERFDTIDILSEIIYRENIKGAVAELGCWKGGMSIYLAYAFPDRKIWVGDSFQGFESLDNCKYDPRGLLFERHHDGVWIANERKVRDSFKEMGLNESNGIRFLPGWVNDTTDPKTCPIRKLAILRVDVDAYSATLVTLENLYDNVVSGGFIIFDDSGLYETQEAIKEFERKKGVEIVKNLYTPQGKPHGFFDETHGLYFRKP